MISKSWDPLAKGKNADAELLSAAQKRELKNIIKSYVGMYDSFSELIQNAMDSVDRRSKFDKTEGYVGKLWITINLAENSFSITDNGVGFNEIEFESFLAPSISFKDSQGSRGNKGVGATYISYGFDYLEFGTKGNAHEFIGVLENGREWVDDNEGVVTRPIVTTSTLKDDIFSKIDRGATFTIKYGGANTRPKDLSWYSATTPEQWLYLLLIKTPLGFISHNDIDESNIKFDLTVIDKQGNSKTLENQSAHYKYPHNIITASVDIKVIFGIQATLMAAGKNTSNIPQKYYKTNGIYEFLSTADVVSLVGGDSVNINLINEYSIEAYGYFTYSTAVWDQLNDHTANLRKGYRVLKGGLQLANNGMMQGDLIVIPLTSNIGYQNQCYVIVHFKNADPDLGRKGFQPELKEIAEKISVAIVNKLKSWRALLRSDSGAKPQIEKESSLHEWIKDQEKHETTNPLSLKNQNFFVPINEISITSEPRSEQDVIVLFNQLIAGGVIRGINLLATSQIMQYDGIYKFVIKEPFNNHIFNKQINPLGVDALASNIALISSPKILEYKYNLDALIHEFESEYKNEKEIHLAIAWEMGEEWKKNYDATSFLDLENVHQRDFHGLTHVLHSATSKFYVIILKELIDYLNDVDGVQSYQKSTYSI